MTLDYQARQGRTSWEGWEINHPQITQITQIFPTKDAKQHREAKSA